MNNLNASTAPPGSAENHDEFFRVEQDIQEAAVIVRFFGDIDITSAQPFQTGLATALAAAAEGVPVVVDLEGVEFLGSAGIAELLVAQQQATRQRVPMRTVASRPIVLRILEVTGATAILDVHASIDAALGRAAT